ncbi:hypothetical protein [Bdellovibrio sp. HCB2-146]|uniref:hypothetical protein n=1 Tax=Bdellovibrio sp. HCB2-146 TaxID=3394362 RepID=UPI0039BD089F
MKALVRIIPGVITLLSTASWALDVRDLQGEKLTTFHSPGGVEERCVVPQKWIPEKFSEDDRKIEAKLCGKDFYSIGICPKYNSSNPGVLLLDPKGSATAQIITNSNCSEEVIDELDVKVDAKFKQSLSCSYTPSVLAYYQISRLFDGAGRVPVSVIRTMDIATHRALTDKANRALRGSRDLIAQTWKMFAAVHENPGKYNAIVDDSRKHIYGAIAQNVKGEYIYTEVNGRGDYDSRYQRFQKQPPFLKVASSSGLIELAGGSSFQKIAPVAVQMKDVSDMVLLDTLLNQTDRIGNIAFKFVWYYQDKAQSPTWVSVKSKAEVKKIDGVAKTIVPPAEIKEFQQGKNAVLVREMYLKDNDCGVAKDNNMRINSVIEKVRHMSYVTYTRFMQMAKKMPLAETRAYFKRELLFTDKDFDSVSKNFQFAKDLLYRNCKSGFLKFDIDLADYVSGSGPSSKSCDI